MKSESGMKNKPDFVMNDPDIFEGRDFVNVRKVCDEGVTTERGIDAIGDLLSGSPSAKDMILSTDCHPVEAVSDRGLVCAFEFVTSNLGVLFFSIDGGPTLATINPKKLDWIRGVANG